MSVRANSGRALAVDGVYFAAVTAIVAGAMSATVRGQDVQTAKTEEVLTDRRLTDDHIDSQLNTDDNMPSGLPTESPEAKRQANMLGMKLYEVRTGHIRVDDVAATSPAWDAGIRRGDRLLSIDTLRPRSLAPWVQEVGRVLEDTPDGNSIAAAVEREGETISLRIRVPVSKAAEVRDARQEERAIANMAGGNQQQVQQLGQPGMMPPSGSGGDVGGGASPYGGYGGTGGIGIGGFGDEGTTGTSGDRIATSAVAQLMAVNTFGSGMSAASNGTTPANGTNTTNGTIAGNGTNGMTTSGDTTSSQNGGQQSEGLQPGGRQVGIAGFENNGQGVRAAVVVQGLVPGTYQVGIGQGGVGGGFGNVGMGNGGLGTDIGAAIGDVTFGDGSQGLNGNQGFNGRNRQRGTGRDRLHDFDENGAANPNQSLPQGTPPFDRPGVQQPINNQRPETPFFPERPGPVGGGVPAGGAGGGGTSGGGSATGGGAAGAGGASLANPNRSPILAQQLDANSRARMNDPSVRGSTPAAQATNPAGNLNVNQPFNNAASSTNGNANNFPNGVNPMGGIGSPQFVAEIGVLQVGQDGSGRVENQLEGMQVSNLAGMSVMVYSPMAQSTGAGQGIGTGLSGSGGRFPSSAEGPQQIGGQAGQGGNPSTQSIGGGMNGIVATGVIRLTESGSATDSAFNESGSQRNNQTDNTGTEQLRDRGRTGTPSDFDPRSPQQ